MSDKTTIEVIETPEHGKHEVHEDFGKPDGAWLHLQDCIWRFPAGEVEGGLRFMWSVEVNGRRQMRAHRGQARIPITTLFKLIWLAVRAGWLRP